MLISVIIPTLNDEKVMVATLDSLLEQGDNFELIVVDGGSTDHSLALVKDRARVVTCPAGTTRGMRLNVGAVAATGDVLLFLWPDSRLPPGTLPAIEHNFKLLPQSIGGNFHVKFDEDSFFTRWLVRRLKQWRYQGHYYGNSGIFIRKEVYLALGGCQPYDILEDYDLARQMERYGPTLYLPETMIASARKFRGRKFQAIWSWLVIHFLFRLGVHPNRLAGLWWKKTPNH